MRKRKPVQLGITAAVLFLGMVFASESLSAQCLGGSCNRGYQPQPSAMMPPAAPSIMVMVPRPAYLSGFRGRSVLRFRPRLFQREQVYDPIYSFQQPQQQAPRQPHYRQEYDGPTPPQWQQPTPDPAANSRTIPNTQPTYYRVYR